MTPALSVRLAPILDNWAIGAEHGPTYVMTVKHCNRAHALTYIGDLVASGHLERMDARESWRRLK